MRVSFDHNVPKKVRQFLTEHPVSTAVEMGWAELENGQLLKAAQDEGFAVMMTGDKNLSYKQNLKERTLAIVVLSTNNWNILKRFPDRLAAAVNAATPGRFQRDLTGFDTMTEGLMRRTSALRDRRAFGNDLVQTRR